MRLQREVETLEERLRRILAELTDIAIRFWKFELVAVEDKMVLEKREIVVKRSVTLGKIVQVLVILVVGIWLTAYLAARVRRMMLKAFPRERNQSAAAVSAIQSGSGRGFDRIRAHHREYSPHGIRFLRRRACDRRRLRSSKYSQQLHQRLDPAARTPDQSGRHRGSGGDSWTDREHRRPMLSGAPL